jgi:hypothetical protein
MPKKKTTVLEGNVDHLFGGKTRLRTSDGKYTSDPVQKMNDSFFGKKKKR